ncbi:unnamed protein product [Paramecium sonneborni]|uniref:Uncharacterized protein n=1 Tax=Paramecium sonneborni TaxID=65129 RepID=A0A8S1M7V1_9CILI|nr:unnamed protein product [Paramecium sonneborni]
MTENSMTDEHKQFIQKISFPGRVELNSNVTLVKFMLKLQYQFKWILFIFKYLPKEQYSYMNNFLQFLKTPIIAMKIFTTLLNQLLVDHFINFQIYDNPDSIFNVNSKSLLYKNNKLFIVTNYIDFSHQY